MIPVGQLLRLMRIQFVLLKHGLDEIVLATHLLRPLRFLMYLSPWYWLRDRTKPRGVRLRQALEDLGPIFVKFGQILSTRPDLLPDDIAIELALLQDQVPPFDSTLAIRIIEQAYGLPLHSVFQSFEVVPLASASIAQVHAAKLPGDHDVVVKVVRPHIEKIIRRDLRLLHTLARLAERYSPDARRLRPRAVVVEFEHTLIDELDLLREAANASQLKRNFQGSHLLYVPLIYWEWTRSSVMVMERVYGTPIAQVTVLKSLGTDMKVLAENGVEIFFTQVFRDCFFHADMHAGNIFVDVRNPKQPRYVAIDFGIMGTLGPADQRYLAENLLAFFHRDYRRVAELHVESGWVPANTRVDEFEAAIRTVCEPIFERPLKDISFGRLLLRLFQTARRFDMAIQPQLVLLQKTLLNVEGLGRELYPELDLWHTAKPYLERWMRERSGFRALFKNIRKHAPYWTAKLPELPELIYQKLQAEARPHNAQSQLLLLQQTERRLVTRWRRTLFKTIGASALLLATFMLINQHLSFVVNTPMVLAGAGVLLVILGYFL